MIFLYYMSGGLMQLVAYGAQDIYLTGNPMITFFKVVYRRHTNFAMESIQQTFSGTANFGGKLSALISRNGDLINGIVLEANLPNITDNLSRWTDNVGHYLLETVWLEIGGQLIDRHYADWFEIWSQLTVPSDRRTGYLTMIGQDPKDAWGQPTGLQLAQTTGTVTGRKIYVPLQFWFCRNIGLSLPLIALQYHEVKISIQFASLSTLAMNYNDNDTYIAQNLSLTNVALWADFIYLDTDERRRFAQVSHEYLIEQLQFSGDEPVGGVNMNVSLNLNHPVKELIWVCRSTSATIADQWNNYTTVTANTSQLPIRDIIPVITTVTAVTNTAPFTSTVVASLVWNQQGGGSITSADAPVTLAEVTSDHVFTAPTGGVNPTATAKLKLNGHDRMGARDGTYFNWMQCGTFHTNIPHSPGINVYSFAIKPEDHQPSGTCNFSRIDNAQLVLTINPAFTAGILKVFAVNYNVLRIMSGMGGLAYSN